MHRVALNLSGRTPTSEKKLNMVDHVEAFLCQLHISKMERNRLSRSIWFSTSFSMRAALFSFSPQPLIMEQHDVPCASWGCSGTESNTRRCQSLRVRVPWATQFLFGAGGGRGGEMRGCGMTTQPVLHLLVRRLESPFRCEMGTYSSQQPTPPIATKCSYCGERVTVNGPGLAPCSKAGWRFSCGHC